MKRLLIPALGLILMGQGCFAPAPTEETPTPGAPPSATTMPVPAPGHLDVDEMIVDGDGEGMMDESVEGDKMEEALNIDLESDNFFFAPDTFTAAPGQTVNVTFAKNNGFHTFVIEDMGFKQRIVEGNTVTFTAPTEPGSYFFFCDIGNHRALGMEGVLTVR